MVGEMQLEAGDARQRAGRRADLGGEVGVGREIVPRERRFRGEAATRQLHPVAGVPGEPDYDGIELLNGLCHLYLDPSTGCSG